MKYRYTGWQNEGKDWWTYREGYSDEPPSSDWSNVKVILDRSPVRAADRSVAPPEYDWWGLECEERKLTHPPGLVNSAMKVAALVMFILGAFFYVWGSIAS